MCTKCHGITRGGHDRWSRRILQVNAQITQIRCARVHHALSITSCHLTIEIGQKGLMTLIGLHGIELSFGAKHVAIVQIVSTRTHMSVCVSAAISQAPTTESSAAVRARDCKATIPIKHCNLTSRAVMRENGLGDRGTMCGHTSQIRSIVAGQFVCILS
jgi:hypothetical protein